MREALDKFDLWIPGKELNLQMLIKCVTNSKDWKYKKGITDD